MLCPRCGEEGLVVGKDCSSCGYSGDPDLLEELGHIRYLLGELKGWQGIAPVVKKRLRGQYGQRLAKLEIALGLRLEPISPDQAEQAGWELACLEASIEKTLHWVQSGWVRPEPGQAFVDEASDAATKVRDRFGASSRVAIPRFEEPEDRLKLLDHLLANLENLRSQGDLVDEEAFAAADAGLEAERQQLEAEIEAASRRAAGTAPSGLRARRLVAGALEERIRRPREPLTWERAWRTLLSERTLNVMLFLGVFLLFASAVTLVVFNWERFAPLVQVLFIAAFTLTFYAAGWFVRAKMGLRSSGIGLTAIGSLLVPIDFYAFYLSGGFPREAWPQVWLGVSLLCLVAYLFTALRIQAPFFGYLVGIAAGSVLCAALRVVGVGADWWPAGVSILYLASAPAVDRLSDTSQRWRVLRLPLWHVALLAATVILPLTLTGYAAGRGGGLALRLTLAINWWLGSAIYAAAAARFRSRGLGLVVAGTVPAALYLSQAWAFDQRGIVPGWHGLGWALLALCYVALGRALLTRSDEVDQGFGRTATAWGIGLMALATVWSATEMPAASVTHLVVGAAVAVSARLWRRPVFLFPASLLFLSAMTTGMASRDLVLGQLALGWALLSILHIAAAIALRKAPSYASPVYASGYGLAALSMIPPLVGGDRGLLTYGLGNWIALAGWSAWLAHGDDHPALTSLLRWFGPFRRSAPHWAAAAPLPVFLWLAWTLNDRAADARLGLVFMLLAWASVAIGRWRVPVNGLEGSVLAPIFGPRLPWYAVGYGCSVLSPLLICLFWNHALLAVALWAATAIYFLSAWGFRQRWWLVPAGVALPMAYVCTLDLVGLPFDPMGAALALVPALYLLGGLVLERVRGEDPVFLAPLSRVGHLLSAAAVLWGLSALWNRLFWGVPWTDVARLWAVAGQLLLGVTYGLLAWCVGDERWGHVAAWLGVTAGGLLATVYSQGRGSSAAKAALLAVTYVLWERGMHATRDRWAWAGRAWPLFQRPLLVAGWAVSGGAILLALVRNLVLLGGGRGRELWAIVALVMVASLYALSARLFRRALFVWLAAVVVFAPWTLLTHLNWFLRPYGPPLVRYALAWVLLAWLQMMLGLLVDAYAGLRYGRPLRVVSHVILPLSVLWGAADVEVSSLTCGLGLVFYILATVVDHRRRPYGVIRSRFLYPAAVLAPVWTIYLLARFAPAARHEHFGLMLLCLAPVGLAIGRLLRRADAADEVPVRSIAYCCALIGTMLVAHDRTLLAGALLYDALLSVISAWVFRQPLWLYVAAALTPASLLLGLAEAGVDPQRRGWALIGLAAAYLALGWTLRRLRLRDYATPVLAASYVLVALGLPPSSHDQIGAFWGYGAAAVLYALSAVWLRQPLFLTLSAALCTVPWGVALVRSPLPATDYGLALWPGILLSLLLAHLLDSRAGAYTGFPWNQTGQWVQAAGQRLLNWWALPWYVLGYGAAPVSALLSWGDSPRLALTLALSGLVFAAAAIRFRLRGWLLAAAIAGQAAALASMDTLGWLDDPAWGAMAFVPVTVVTVALALFIERRQGEGSPFEGGWRGLSSGWSRPLYALVAVDMLVAQPAALSESGSGVVVSLVHGLLLAVLATIWAQPILPYLAEALGLLALLQHLARPGATPTEGPVALALLSFGYGVAGYGLAYVRRREKLVPSGGIRVWEQPLQRGGLLSSLLALGLMSMMGVDVISLSVRALLGLPLLESADVVAVQMMVGVLAVTGLLYLAVALVERQAWLGYGAVILLLCGWSLEWFFVWGMREPQWYAVPAGLYLLGVGYLEWWQDRRTLARWIDRAGLMLLLFSSFWQSMTEPNGWPYALLMGAEALFIVWWGSARRQRRFLYFGVAGVVVDVAGQSVEPLLSANRWIVFGVAGLILVGVAVLVERQLEALTRLSRELRERLEEWE